VPPTPPHSRGLNGRWSKLNGKPVRPEDKDHRKIVIAFDADRGTFTGTSGCNNLSGRFATKAAPLTLTFDKAPQICRVDQRTERAVRSVITNTQGYRVTPTTLELLDANGQLLAKLER
jgi:heat shock protein HslJ